MRHTHQLVPGLQHNQESHNLWSLYHLALLAHLQIKHTERFISNVIPTEVRTLMTRIFNGGLKRKTG